MRCFGYYPGWRKTTHDYFLDSLPITTTSSTTTATPITVQSHIPPPAQPPIHPYSDLPRPQAYRIRHQAVESHHRQDQPEQPHPSDCFSQYPEGIVRALVDNILHCANTIHRLAAV